VVAAHLRTVTALCPAVRAFLEHYLFVIADELRTSSGQKRRNSGHRPGATGAISSPLCTFIYKKRARSRRGSKRLNATTKKPTPGAPTTIVMNIRPQKRRSHIAAAKRERLIAGKKGPGAATPGVLHPYGVARGIGSKPTQKRAHEVGAVLGHQDRASIELRLNGVLRSSPVERACAALR
jgi:hypothetical protein